MGGILPIIHDPHLTSVPTTAAANTQIHCRGRTLSLLDLKNLHMEGSLDDAYLSQVHALLGTLNEEEAQEMIALLQVGA